MHDASSEDVIREKHRGTPHGVPFFERCDDGRYAVGSLNAEVIIFLRKDAKFRVARVVKS